MESNALCYVFSFAWLACLFLITKKVIFIANVKALSHQRWNESASGWRKGKFTSV